jgi:hypothetical protein
MNLLLLIEITELIPGPAPTASELRGRRNPGGVCRQYMEAETFLRQERITLPTHLHIKLLVS